jgi:archaellum component FlaC
MLICHTCRQTCTTVKGLLMHIKREHRFFNRYGLFYWAQPLCGRSFHDKYVLSRRLMNEHASDLDYDMLNTDSVGCLPGTSTCSGVHKSVDDADNRMSDDDMDVNDTVDNDLEELQTLAAEFICKCKRSNTSLSVVNEIISSCSMFVESVVEKLQKRVIDVMQQLVSDKSEHILNQIEMTFSQYKQPFQLVSTLHQQNKYWKDKGYFIEPQQYVIGSRPGYSLHSSTGLVVPQIEEVTGQFVSVMQMLQAYLRDESKAVLVTNTPTADEKYLRTYFDGKKWQEQKN